MELFKEQEAHAGHRREKGIVNRREQRAGIQELQEFRSYRMCKLLYLKSGIQRRKGVYPMTILKSQS
jgi:hypothetical protein